MVLFGIVQAVLMGIWLLVRNKHVLPAAYFSLILLTLGGLSFKILLHTLGLWERPAFHYFPLAIDTLLPVWLYAYLRSVTGDPISVRMLSFYLMPFFFLMAHAVLVYALPSMAGKLYYDAVKNLEDSVALVYAAGSWLLSFRRLRLYRRWLFQSQSDSRLVEFGWLRNLLVLSGILVLVFLSVFVLEDVFQVGQHDFVVLQLFYLYLAGLSYYLSLKGYLLYNSGSEAVEVSSQESDSAANLPAEADIIQSRIILALETDRVYLRPELNLKELSRHVGFPSAAVSAVINQRFNQNFRNLVNGYRVEAVKAMLASPPAHLSLLGIALECGFNSEASFYRIFRDITGSSPNEYLQKINAQKRF